MKFSQKISFGTNGQFRPDCGLKLRKPISQDPPEVFYSNFAA